MSDLTEKTNAGKVDRFAREEWFLGIGLASSIAFVCFGKSMLAGLSNPLWLILVLVWLFVAVLGSIICVVRHADHLAIRLGEPYGTLILTLSAISIEVVMISTAMLHGANNPTLGRDAIFAV